MPTWRRLLTAGKLPKPLERPITKVGKHNSMPQQIIARGTDWRFLNELKKELKA